MASSLREPFNHPAWKSRPSKCFSTERRKLSGSSRVQKHTAGTVRMHHSFISQANSPRPHCHQIYVWKRKQLPSNSYNGEESAAHLHILLYCLPNSTSDCPRIQRKSSPPAGSTGGRSARSRPWPSPCGPPGRPLPGHCQQLLGSQGLWKERERARVWHDFKETIIWLDRFSPQLNMGPGFRRSY